MSKEKRKVIITCAVTGAIHTPSMSKYLPVSPDEIADAAILAAIFPLFPTPEMITLPF